MFIFSETSVLANRWFLIPAVFHFLMHSCVRKCLILWTTCQTWQYFYNGQEKANCIASFIFLYHQCQFLDLILHAFFIVNSCNISSCFFRNMDNSKNSSLNSQQNRPLLMKAFLTPFLLLFIKLPRYAWIFIEHIKRQGSRHNKFIV